MIGTADTQNLVHRNPFQIDVQQLAFDRLILPVHDHRLGLLAALSGRSKIVLWPESEFRIFVIARGST